MRRPIDNGRNGTNGEWRLRRTATISMSRLLLLPRDTETGFLMTEFIVWLKEGGSVIVDAHLARLSSGRLIFRDEGGQIVALFTDHAGFSKRDSIRKDDQSEEGNNSL